MGATLGMRRTSNPSSAPWSVQCRGRGATLVLVLGFLSHVLAFDSLRVTVNSRVAASEELVVALKRNDSRTIILNSDITTRRLEGFNDTVITDGRSVLIEGANGGGDSIDDPTWSLPPLIPVLKVASGGKLTLANFTMSVRDPGSPCGPLKSRKDWYFKGQHMGYPVFGALLPRALYFDSDSMSGEPEPALVRILSMQFEFERCCDRTVLAMENAIDIASDDAGNPDNPTLEPVGPGLRFVCPHCFFQGLPIAALLPSSQATPPVANVEVFNTTVICRTLFPREEAGPPALNIAMTICGLVIVVAGAGGLAYIVFVLAMRVRKWARKRQDKTASPEGQCVIGVPLPQALGECVKDAPKDDGQVAYWSVDIRRDVAIVPQSGLATSIASLPVPQARDSPRDLEACVSSDARSAGCSRDP